mmetsp:Transcript_66357/g.130740  ORF Transcript_66357/g.130740 Transcript_66357/m.130740 type:complete len:900 (-) Transcript_66357:15-2714(-)
MTSQANSDRDEGTETKRVSKDEAAFILGQGGRTKAKLCAVSGAQIDVNEGRNAGGASGGSPGGSQLRIRGTAKQRFYALKYIKFVIAQRLGPVKIEDTSVHDDLAILVVPADTVSFIMGKGGSYLRLVEEEWQTLLFFLSVNPKNPRVSSDPTRTERLAIFGPDERRRRGAELKVMAAIETKLPGHFTVNVTDFEDSEEGFATDTLVLKDEDCSYAIGRSGATRRKLARASSCIVEYVGRIAYLCGTKTERACAREYLQWLLRQRVGEHIHVEHNGRQDVTMLMLSSNFVGYIAGHKGSALRAIEEETSTFCFIEGTADDSEDQKPLLIFGCAEDRRVAEGLVWERMSEKFDDPAVADEDVVATGRGRRGGRGGRASGRDRGETATGGRGGGNRARPGNNGATNPARDTGANAGNYMWPPPMTPDQSLDSVAITDEDAAFLMGPGGKTKKKIAAVSGALMDLKANRLEIVGTEEERARARKYVKLVMAQRVGPVRLDDIEQHADLSIVDVPAEAVSFVTGKQGAFLRFVEEDFGTLLFFIDFSKANKRDQLERLAIFGPLRQRRGAELKVMAAIEMKQPGYFTDPQLPMEDPSEGFATDRIAIAEDDYSYALGKGGTTRKKIARASGCVIEYVGRLAYLSGIKRERMRAREYLGWLFRQRVGPVEVDYACREDVSVLQVPKDCVGFVTGFKGTSLRSVEDATGTFCFIEGGRDDPHRDPKPLLIFGDKDARRQAEELLRKRIEQKLVEGWVHEEHGGGRHGGRRAQRGGGRGGGGGHSAQHAGSGGQAEDGSGGAGHRGQQQQQQQQYAPREDSATNVPAALDTATEDDGWGDWGGPSDDQEETEPSEVVTPSRWSTPYAAPTAIPPAFTGSLRPGATGGREPDLPPHLLHEEAWPELG